MTGSNVELTNDVAELMDAAFSDWNGDREGAEEALATVPLKPLVALAAMALPGLKDSDPETYARLVEKHKLVPQDE